ncbi:MAG: hypothetical protein HY694_18605 [Deltaproteobacteria bacterium]|nr:hypothetical protein [Deltaproteobacteria bacterium]
MTYPYGSPGFSGSPYNGSSESDGPPIFGRNRVVLVAIHGDLLPPIFRERSALQRTRVVLLPPDETGEFGPTELLPRPFRRALPHMPPALPMPRKSHPQPRSVQGEILRDDRGRLYEKIGEQIRPLHKLVSGPSGEILELVPSGEPIPEARGPVVNQPYADFDEKADDEMHPGGHHEEQHVNSSQSRPVAETGAANAKPAPCRKLFPDPGQGRVVRLGDFKSMLAPQLAHPERLRDTHRLACYLQVYEATTAQRLESLAAAVLGDPGRVSQLQPLTERIAHQLGLMALLRSRPRVPSNFPREARLLLPYERVFRLQPAQDPTADDVTPPDRHPPKNLQTRETIIPPAMPHSAPTMEPSGQKKAIPERFLNPREFTSTREEVLYDMNVTAIFSGWLSSLRRRLKGWIGGRREWKRWRALLYGKTVDEQLWAIRPPKGGLSHPAIRDWAWKTLEAAGYEPRAMLLEWEIFWRRKGV